MQSARMSSCLNTGVLLKFTLTVNYLSVLLTFAENTIVYSNSSVNSLSATKKKWSYIVSMGLTEFEYDRPLNRRQITAFQSSLSITKSNVSSMFQTFAKFEQLPLAKINVSAMFEAFA